MLRQRAIRKITDGVAESFKSTKKGPKALFSGLQTSKICKLNLERETRLELATPTLARSCSTN